MLKKFKPLIISAIVLVLIVTSFMPQIIEAQGIEFARWQKKVAEQNQRFSVLNEKLGKYRDTNSFVQTAKAEEALNPWDLFLKKENSITFEDCQKDPACKDLPMFGVIAKESAMVGQTIPVIVLANNAINIEKVNLSISDPRGNDWHFKATYENIKKNNSFLFSYNWDTLFAQTYPDTAETNHMILAEFFGKDPVTNQFYLIDKYQTSVHIYPKTSFNIKNDSFWGPYLKQDGSFSSSWKSKLGCQNCKDMNSVKDALPRAINAGTFTMEDYLTISESVEKFITQLNTDFPSGDDPRTQAMVDWFNVSDAIGIADEALDAKDGVPMLTYNEEVLKMQESITIARVLEEYSTKIASYEPKSADDFRALPFWEEMANKMLAEIDKDPVNKIEDLEEIAPPGTATSSANNSYFALFAPEKAKAWVQALITLGFAANDIYNMVKKPSWANAGWIALDAGCLALDLVGLGAATRAVVGGGRIGAKLLSKIPVLRTVATKAVGLYTAIKGSKVLTKTIDTVNGLKAAIAGGKVKFGEFLAAHPNIKKILDYINPTRSALWALFTGAQKKLITWTRAIANFAARYPGTFVNILARVLGSVAGLGCKNVCEKFMHSPWNPSGWLKDIFSTITVPVGKLICSVIAGVQQAIYWIYGQSDDGQEINNPYSLTGSESPLGI